MFNIKISYLIVFISLIFWASFAFVTMNEQISNQQVYAKIINISGKQRMLSQKTTLIAKRVYETNDKKLTKHLGELITLMKKDHQFILEHLTTQKIQDIYYQHPYNLDKNVKTYFYLLDTFYKNKDLETLQSIERYSFTLLGKLNHAVNEFEKESDINTSELRGRELFIFIGTLITLFLEAIFIIIPTIRQIDSTKKQMKEFNKTLTEKIEEQKEIILQETLEKKEKEKIILEKERQASMGEMITNIAHQWRQPLSIISTSASGMKIEKEYGILKDEQFYKLCDSIDENAQYLSNTINDFSKFVTSQEKTSYLLNDEITNIVSLLDESIKLKNIQLTLNIDDSISIYGFKNELTQSLITILNNAQDAVSKNKIEDKNITITTSINQKNSIKIQIKDNGGGISQDIISKIFDPYFTTKHQKQGTGLGLHMAYNIIVLNMNGTLKAKNIDYTYNGTLYKGTEFIISLPQQ